MRFKLQDLPGIAIALLAGPALMLLFLASFEVWGHHGTPLLGAMGSNLGIAAGLAAVFSRFIFKWDVPLAFVALILGVVGTVFWLQNTDNDGGALATSLKWVGVFSFFGLNLAIVYQLVQNGLLPILDRRDARRAEAETE